MKIILSRKGFDSSAGGCPSPILPDGRLLTLPIPDAQSLIRYSDIDFGGDDGALISQLTKGRLNRGSRAHLDPDLVTGHLPRHSDWKPVLGQSGAAQGHLRKQDVGVGDLFIFFGLFRPVERFQRRWRFVPGSRAKHIIWGWLQVGEVAAVDDLNGRHSWLDYHPHLQMAPDPNNVLYIANDRLILDGHNLSSGSGCFSHFESKLQLTDKDSINPSLWSLPGWFYPDGRMPLTYHQKQERWQRSSEGCQLQCAARGQEFVLDSEQYPESLHWVKTLIAGGN